ncbi:MAG: DUF485 domain-containing protein [Bacillota bacterium]
MASSGREIENSPEFKSLVVGRWAVAVILTIVVFITYYGFILMVGYAKPTLAQKIGTATTLGIPLAVLVIVIGFIVTLVYVLWANSKYDQIVYSLKRKLKEKM